VLVTAEQAASSGTLVKTLLSGDIEHTDEPQLGATDSTLIEAQQGINSYPFQSISLVKHWTGVVNR
jgi:hypothetical protein